MTSHVCGLHSFTDVTEKDKTKEKKREVTVAPDMPFDKPQLTELEDNVIRLTWPTASLPPGAKSTPIRFILFIFSIVHTDTHCCVNVCCARAVSSCPCNLLSSAISVLKVPIYAKHYGHYHMSWGK